MKTVRLLLTALMLGGLSVSAVSLQASARPYNTSGLPSATLPGELLNPYNPNGN